MGGTKAQYSIIIDAQNKATAAFKEVQSALDKTGDGVKAFESKMNDLEPAFRNMRNYGAIAFTALSAGITKLAMDAKEVDRVEQTFAALTKSIGAAPDAVNELRKATMGLVDDTSLMKAGNKFISMGLAENAEQMNTLANMAVRLGSAMGNNATESMENFALMLANQSIPRLDSFGISSGKVRTRIEELMTANEGMTRETAFMTAVMEQGNTSLERLGDATLTPAERMQQFAVQLENTKSKIGQALIPALEQMLSAIQPVLEKTMAWIDANPELVGRILLVATAVAGLIAILGTVGLALGAVTTATTALGVAFAFIAANPIVLLVAALAVIFTMLKDQIAQLFGVELTWKQVWTDGVVPIFQGAVDIISDGMLALFGWFESITNKVQSLIDRLSSLKGVASSVASTVASLALPGFGAAMSFLPKFATGGVVNAPVGQPVLATVHGGEEIVPYSQRGSSAGIVVNINGGIFADESGARMVADQMVRALQTQYRF